MPYLLHRLLRDDASGGEHGQGVIEYTLVTGVIAIGLFAAFTTAGLTSGIGNAVTGITGNFPG